MRARKPKCLCLLGNATNFVAVHHWLTIVIERAYSRGMNRALILSCCLLCSSSLAQDQGLTQLKVPAHAPIDLAVVPPLSVNALADDGVADNNLALGLLAHRARSLTGVGVAPFASLVDQTLRGAQVALFSRAQRAYGLQLGLFSYANEGMAGAQVGGANLTDSARGLQLGALVNGSRGTLMGAQVGLLNLVGEDAWGLQLGGVNRARDVTGVQVGGLNLARHSRGLMLGLVNVADSADAPIGVINWIRDGEQHLAVYGSELNVANFAAKLGGRHLYSHLVFGVGRSGEATRFSWGAGLGARWRPSVRVFLEAEVVEQLVSFGQALGGPSGLVTTARFNVGFQLLRRLAITVGPSLNLYVPLDDAARLTALLPGAALGTGARAAQLLPGVAIGIQL